MQNFQNKEVERETGRMINSFLISNLNLVAGEGEVNVEGIKTYLEENKDSDDVKTFLAGINPINEDSAKKYLTEDRKGKKLLGTMSDEKVNAAVQSYEEKFTKEKLPALIEEKYKKDHPDESEEQKQIRTLSEKVEAQDKKLLLKEMKEIAIEVMTDLELPFIKHSEMFITDNKDKMVKRIEAFNDTFTSEVEKAVAVKLRENGRDPHKEKKGEEDPKIKKLQAEYDKAIKDKRLQDAIYVKQQIFNLEKEKAKSK